MLLLRLEGRRLLLRLRLRRLLLEGRWLLHRWHLHLLHLLYEWELLLRWRRLLCLHERWLLELLSSELCGRVHAVRTNVVSSRLVELRMRLLLRLRLQRLLRVDEPELLLLV